MKENDNNEEDDKNEYLLKKGENKSNKYRRTFPLGYQDKRAKKFYKPRKSRQSKNSSKSGSSESIEEKNEELEDESLNNKKNNSTDNDSGNKNDINIDLLADDNLNQYALNADSDSEIVEEEIISEEMIAQIYKNKDELKEKKSEDLNLVNYNIITPVNENNIVKENNKNEIESHNIILKQQKKEKKEKIVKKRENLLFKYFNHKSLIGKLRIITLIIMILYIIISSIAIFAYIYNKDKKTIFCFEFLDYSNKKGNKENNHDNDDNNKNIEDKENEKFFLSDKNSFFLINTLLLITFLSVMYSLIKNEYLQLKQFFKEMSLFFPLTLILNMPIYIIGIIQNKYDDVNDPKIWTPIFFFILTFLGVVFMSIVLVNAKKHKFKSISSLINISVLCSFLTAFECYCFIYCFCFLLRSCFIKIGKRNVDNMSVPEIIAGIIYFAIGFFNITALRDIYFSFIVVIVEIGLLYIRKNYSIGVVCFNLITTFFTFASIVIAIFKYKKKVFGLAHVD